MLDSILVSYDIKITKCNHIFGVKTLRFIHYMYVCNVVRGFITYCY